MMETIRVNMTPCEDIKTIHASQNDNEAREWGFELHNNGEKIDSSSISDQLVFKAYKGGTEQILPTNGSTPTTSPFKGDIKYPQGLLSDQEFLYRESPTEEDGLAKITDIKGNTIVWNQVAPSMSSSAWVQNRCTKTVSGNTFTLVGTNHTSLSFGVYIALTNLKLTVNHNYLFMCVVNTNRGTQIRFTFDSDIRYTTITPNKDNVYSRAVSTATEDPVVCYISHPSSITTSDTATIKNLMIVDLTMLNDSRITDLNSFKTYYPLPYYAYNQGTLLSFMGNGIKTTGKNLLPSQSVSSVTGVSIVENNGVYTLNGTSSGYQQAISTSTLTFPKGTYTLYSNGGDNNVVGVQIRSTDGTVTYASSLANASNFALTEQTEVKFRIVIYASTFVNKQIAPQLEFGSSATSYEPYTTSTTSLPISTYFPTGMKSAGSVYDELTETKAITRIGSVDLGTLTWNYNSTYNAFSSTGIANIAKGASNSQVANTRSIYDSVSLSTLLDTEPTKNGLAINSYGNIWVRNTSYNDATAFKTAMNGIPLYFEISAYQETSFSTASLVTENAEIPLSNEDGILIGKCTEQLSENPGFFDAKIKLSDGDGTCYSNKIQLHIERSPQ